MHTYQGTNAGYEKHPCYPQLWTVHLKDGHAHGRQNQGGRIDQGHTQH